MKVPGLFLIAEIVSPSQQLKKARLFRGRLFMSTNSETLFEAFLNQHDSEAWSKVLTELSPYIHKVDGTATQIWFAFFPIAFQRLLAQAEDRERVIKELLLKGNFELKDQIDSSHRFLYGHRFCPEVKKAVTEQAASTRPPETLDLTAMIRKIASETATRLKVEESLLTGITAVAFMTLQQVGFEAFKASPGRADANRPMDRKTPDQILKERAKDDKQGFFGFLKSVDKVWTVTFNENDEGAKFKLINGQDLAMAATSDPRDYKSLDSRCKEGEGPIPVECRTAACGTCWVGVIGGAEKLAEATPREKRKIKEFGYICTDDPKPIIRLACMTQAFGAVSIVIPPWNGVFGRRIGMYKPPAIESEKSKTAHG